MITTTPLTRSASLDEWLDRLQRTLGPVVAASTQRGLAFRPAPTDLFISPFAKCGATWLQQIVHGLRTHGDMAFTDLMEVTPWLEMTDWLGIDPYAPQRGAFRVFKSHLSWRQIPKGGRYIVSFRDPKDALLSYYHFLNGHHWQAGTVSLRDYANATYLTYQGGSWDGSYWGHLLSWWEQRDNPNVLLLCYEAMQADLPGTVRAIAHFLDIPLDQPLLDRVVQQASLDFMRAHKPKFSEPMLQEAMAQIGFAPPSDTLSKVRTGRVGDHRAELPGDIAAQMDAIWQATVTAKTGLASYQAIRTALHEAQLRHTANPTPQPRRPLPRTATEIAQFVQETNATAVDLGTAQSVHALFEAQVARTPAAVALVLPASPAGKGRLGQRVTLSYAELNTRANQLAHYLIQTGVRTETPVGICLPRGVDQIVATLAISKAGGAYVPLDPAYPPARLQFMVRDAGVTLILTTADLAAALPSVTPWVDLPGLVLAAYPTTNPDLDIAGDNLLYIMYTSGSTGEPKGIEILQRNVLRLVNGTTYARLDADQTVLQLASPAFDAATFEIWGSLCNGAKLVLYPEQQVDLALLAQTLHTEQVSVLFLTTALFHQMVETHLDGLRGVRQLLVGGEVTSPQHVRRVIEELGPTTTYIACYGPTENTTFTTTLPLTDPALVAQSVPIGVPISNTQVYLLDEAGQLTPIGEAGELYTGGVGVARGYRDRPALTAERFIDHPHFGRLYKTGDLCRWVVTDPEMPYLEFLGRTDFQVKLRGFRIELGEIENALLAQPGVQAALVLLREESPGDKRLVAYLVGDIATGQLRKDLAERLPAYMLPSAWVLLPAMPLTPNGKIDRNALPPPVYGDEETAYLAPRDALEEAVAAIWCDTLHLDRVGVNDDFFALGGHSLLATRVVARIRREFARDLPIAAIFATPRLADFAQTVRQAQATAPALGNAESHPRLRPAQRPAQLPLSFAQQRLWFLNQLEPESAFYNLPTLIRLTGPLDVAALAQSFTYLIARHESLRTTFATGADGAAFQVIHPPQPFSLTALPVTNEQAAQQLIRQAAIAPFDLRRGPLVRVQLFQLAPEEHLLLFTLHHIISDGWSMGILIQELTHAYGAYTRGEPPTLPALPLHYADFALWQRDYLRGDRLARQLAFWREQLAGAPALLALPTDRPRPSAQSYRGAHYAFQLARDLTNQLKQLAQTHEATLFMVLLAALNVLLARYSRQTDIVIGAPIAGRNQSAIDGLIGFFVNTLALRTRLDDHPTFVDLLARVRQSTLAAYDQQDLPFEQLVDDLAVERTLRHSPLFQVMMALQNADLGSWRLPNLMVQEETVNLPFAKFDLVLDLREDAQGGLAGFFEYATDLFDEATIARMVGHFIQLLESIVSQPERPVLHLPMLPDAEYRQIVHEWNDTAVDFGEPQTIHALFEQQAARTPDATALISAEDKATRRQEPALSLPKGDTIDNAFAHTVIESSCHPVILSYRELNAQANQLARHLVNLGVKTDTLVAVAMERSPDLVVCLLAVLKAGGAYIPIDPTYPPERIRYMLADSTAPILLTQSQLAVGHIAGSQATGSHTLHDMLHVIVVDQDRAQWATQPTTNLQSATKPTDLVYVIYTSGSTGQPKGVMVQHDQLYNLICWYQCAFGVNAQTRASQMANPAFDASAYELFPNLTKGATVLFPPEEKRLSPPALIEWFADQAITIAYVPTPIANTLLAMKSRLSLQWLQTGGDRLTHYPPDDATFTLVNNYGPTETTIVATASFFTAQAGNGAPHIGQAIANVQAYILDEALQPVPLNVPGELYIGGRQVARGYLNRPALTAERFLQHPVWGRLYKTGDRCRWLPNPEGTPNIDFLGRTDAQVKLRGFRIELGEIEHVLLAQDGVREAVVVLWEDEVTPAQLVAYVVGETDSDTLHSRLAEHLPDYMIPSAFVQLEAMPLTPNGKLDRRALPKPDYAADKSEFVAPRNAVEAALVQAFTDVLHISQVGSDGKGIGIHDNFFQLGGDSILSIQIVSLLAQQGYTLRVKDLFQFPTVAQLATVVREHQPTTPQLFAGAVPDHTSVPLPAKFTTVTLSAAQLAALWHEATTPATAHVLPNENDEEL